MTLRRSAAVALACISVIVGGCGAAESAAVPEMSVPTHAGPVGPSPYATTMALPKPVVAPVPSRPPPTLRLPAPATPAGPPRATASRVVIDAYDIDLPVIAGDADVAGNDPGYPLCDVAQYLTGYRQPGEPGTTYLYAHAQMGMFLPLLEASERHDGGELLGTQVLVYTDDLMVHRYEIWIVKRHATDYQLADSVRPGDQRLILQTSEGPRGTVPKLQLAARLVATETSSATDALRTSRPRVCA